MESNGDLRFDRLARYGGLGASGLAKLADARVAVAGCGGLGCGVAMLLARYPLGGLTLIDRDVVDESNLGHQLLFLPGHASAHTPKAIAAAEHVAAANPGIAVEPVYTDLRASNIEKTLGGIAQCERAPGDTTLSGIALPGHAIVLDGLDNFSTRFLINDWCLKNRVPYIYGGLVEAEGVMKAIVPGVTSCLRCLMPEPPPPGTTRTCDVYGIHLPVVPVLAGLMVNAAIAILTGQDAPGRNAGIPPASAGELVTVNLSGGSAIVKSLKGSQVRNPNCPACNGRYDFLSPVADMRAISVCGMNAIAMTLGAEVDIAKFAGSLPAGFSVRVNPHFIRAKDEATGLKYSVFSHGRVVMEGSEDEAVLRSFVSRYIGD